MNVQTVLIFLILFCLLFSFPAPLQAQSNASLPPDLQALVAEALKANPEIKQMGELRNASKEAIRSAGALDDPELGFSMKDVPTDTWRLNQDPMTQKELEISQKFPFPGKRRLRSEVAAEAKEAHLNAWNQLSAMIKDRYIKLQRLDQQIKLYQQAIVPQARQAAEASLSAYQVGTQDFARLYQDVIEVYNAELQLQEYLMDFEGNWAELEWLVGQELPRRAGGGK